MSESTLKPGYFGPESRRLFGVRHIPRVAPRAAVLICPPLLHEHVRSYRFFSQVASRFADDGLACLRFDYYGTGDSEGDDSQFHPDQVTRDLQLAALELREVSGDVPMIVMGVRASALLVCREVPALGASAIWLWQPVDDAAAYVQSLDARDRSERASDNRYPLLRGSAPAQPEDLMGFRLNPDFRKALAACTLSSDISVPSVVVDSASGEGRGIHADAHYQLPEALAAWTTEIDLDGLIPFRAAEPTIRSLLSEQVQRVCHG